jgi:hypothetical protein
MFHIIFPKTEQLGTLRDCVSVMWMQMAHDRDKIFI